jgi:hypothetical protein
MIIGINMIDKIFLICPYCGSQINPNMDIYFHCQAINCWVHKSYHYKYRIWHDEVKITGYELWNETGKYYLDSFNMPQEIRSKIRIVNYFGEEQVIHTSNFFIPLEEKVTDNLLDSYKEKIILLNVFQ